MATDARHSLLLHSVKLDTPYTDDTGERTREHIDEMQHSRMGLGEAGWGGVEGQEAAHSGIEMNSESSSSLCRNWDPKAAMRPIDASNPRTELRERRQP